MTPPVLLALLLASAQAAPAPADPLSPLAMLVGSCWHGRFAEGDLTDLRCVEPMLGGAHIRDRHSVVGTGYAGETIYSWDADRGQIGFAYHNSLGGVARGWIEISDDGFAGSGVYRGPNGETQNTAFTLHIEGDRMVQRSYEDGRETARIDFVRRPAGAFPKLGEQIE